MREGSTFRIWRLYWAERGCVEGKERKSIVHLQLLNIAKFAANLDLARNGYNFVFLDGDVYLTGSVNPFDAMLPLSDDSFDIQFRPDEGEPHRGLNIGWYFARSNVATIRYFERSNEIWEESGRKTWDQEVMDKLGQKMEFEEHSLKVYRLYGKRFQNMMLNDWEQNLFGNEAAIGKFIDDAAMIHYTCVQQNLKTYFGLNFGGYGDLESYYSKPPPLIAMVNVSGQSDSIHGQIAFAAQIANKTGRTLIWPDSVDMIQRVHYDETENDPEWTDFLHNPSFPGIRVASYGEAEAAGLKVVEGRYLHNHARNTGRPLKQAITDVGKLVLGEHGSIAALEKSIGKLKSMQVAVLDFSNFSPRFLRPADQNLHHLNTLPNIGMRIYSEQERWVGCFCPEPG
jgi:hypothetical protein